METIDPFVKFLVGIVFIAACVCRLPIEIFG